MEFFNKKLNIPIQQIHSKLLESKKVELSILRLDKTDEYISGNKFFKLKYNLLEAEKQGIDTLLTFGGAFSNHIAATAAAGKLAGFQTIGIIRGEEHLPLNKTLSLAIENGMKIHYMDRKTYRLKDTALVINSLREKFGNIYIIPEGGTNTLAIQGTKEIVDLIPEKFDTICCSIGTGGTIAGIIESTNTNVQVLGFSALKGDFVTDMVADLLSEEYNHWEVINEFHFGGFAKTKPELIRFISEFDKNQYVPLEQIYTGKMLYGITEMLRRNEFVPNSHILAIHTGGLQGRIDAL